MGMFVVPFSPVWILENMASSGVKEKECRPCDLLHILCISSWQDFGDYLESYYSVQTNEGEKISQLIAGYIDIILKKVSDSN